LLDSSLSSCHETVALYFGRICTRLEVVHFRVFRLFLWLLATEFSACSKPYPRTQQRALRVGVELRPRNRDHKVAVKTAI